MRGRRNPLVSVEGLEPSTHRLKVYCSTCWAIRSYLGVGVGIEPTFSIGERFQSSELVVSQANLVEIEPILSPNHIQMTLLRPSALSRSVQYLCPTDLYSEGSSYRTTCVHTCVALRLCGEWADYLALRERGREETLALNIYIISHLR